MRFPIAILLVLSSGCTDSKPSGPNTKTTGTTDDSGTAVTDSGDTGDSGTTPVETTRYDYDCSRPFPNATVNAVVGTFGPAEDFDLDGNGYSVQVFGQDLSARNKLGDDTYIISPNITSWAAGTRVLKSGDIVVGDAAGGIVVLIDAITGGKTNVFGSAGWPNGIEVDADGYVYVSDFTSNGFVAKFDPYNPSDWEMVVDNITLPNGIILSPDDQFLYIAGSNGDIVVVDRNADGSWGQAHTLVNPGGSPQGINIDICGNVYWTDGTDQILRSTPDGSRVDVVAELNSGYLPNLRWGHDIGGWEITHLYASDRFAEVMYDIEVGIPGKKHIVWQ